MLLRPDRCGMPYSKTVGLLRRSLVARTATLPHEETKGDHAEKYQRARKIAAAVHAGWRGTAAGIAPRAVASMKEVYRIDPTALHVAMGPSIGPCCYEVGAEVAAQIQANWREEFTDAWKPDGAKGRLDLRALNEAQLLSAGVPRSHIQKIGPCTACNVETYFSYRKEGKSGHQLSFIGWRS